MIKNIPPKKKLFIYYTLIALATLIIYFPSLDHVPRSDHLAYFANTAFQHDWLTLAVKNYAHNRMPLIYGSGGDTLLFRPLCYFFLGTQKWLFGYNFVLWQLTGIICHLIVLWSLLRLLRKIHDGFSSVLLTAFFATLFAVNDLVIWTHITSYMICFAFLLMSLTRIQEFCEQGFVPRRDLFIVTMLLTCAIFIYDTVALFCLFFSVYFAISFKPRQPVKNQKGSQRSKNLIKKSQAAFSFCIPLILYIFFSLLDLAARSTPGQMVDRGTTQPNHFLALLPNVFESIFWWGYLGLFPSQAIIIPAQRHMTTPGYLNNSGLFAQPVQFTVLIGIGMVICYLLMICRKGTRKHIEKQRRLIILLCCMMLTYVAIISFGRMSAKNLIFILSDNPYYAYFFWLIILPIIYTTIPFKQLNRRKSLRPLILFAKIILIASIGNNLAITRSFNHYVKNKTYHYRTLHKEINKIIQEGNKFTIAMDRELDGGYFVEWITRMDTPDDKGHHYLELLYPQFYDEDHPTHYITTADGYWKILPGKDAQK